MFRGINEINMDAKGRMAIPSKYRELLQSHCNGCLVATIDIHDPCLRIYPLPVWEEIESQLGRLPGANPKVRKIQRLLLGHASDIEMDGSGRILLPPMLRKHASLEKELVLVGQEKGFELWNAAAWNSCLDDALADVGELPDEIASIAF